MSGGRTERGVRDVFAVDFWEEDDIREAGMVEDASLVKEHRCLGAPRNVCCGSSRSITTFCINKGGAVAKFGAGLDGIYNLADGSAVSF